MLSTSAGSTLGNMGVEALFFARFGVKFLPYMYMALGVLPFFTIMERSLLLRSAPLLADLSPHPFFRTSTSYFVIY